MKRLLIAAAAMAAITFGMAGSVAHAQAATPAPAKVVAPAPVMVTVEKGDSLSKIATRYTSTWVRIFNANESVENPDLINPGDELRIPTADETLPDRTRPEPPVAKVAKTTKTAAKRTTSSATYVSVSPNDAKSYIYARESGNNPNASNSNGCYGIGQDCNGVLRAQCGADYACQDAYFTNYAMRRYGSWENALAFWQSHHWW